MSSRSGVDFSSTNSGLQKKISSDEELNALKRLRELETDKQLQAEIDGFIRKRLAEIANED